MFSSDDLAVSVSKILTVWWPFYVSRADLVLSVLCFLFLREYVTSKSSREGVDEERCCVLGGPSFGPEFAA